MHPFFFGSSDRPLFGMYYAPTGRIQRNHAVLICNPFGHEGIRSHRLMRQLAERLAGDGEHVLRFDYFGTGDSGGNTDAGSFDGWVGDTRAALQELVDMSAVPKATIVGLRLGAVIAVHSARGRSEVDKLLLWDPVVNGEVYLEEMAELHETRTGTSANLTPHSMPTELVGFALGPRIGLPVSKSRLSELGDWPVANVGIIVSEKLTDYDRLKSRLSELGGESPFAHVPSTMHWKDVSFVGELLQAPEALNAVQNMLSQVNGG